MCALRHPEGDHVRKSFRDELGQLRIQVELMGVTVDQNLDRMRCVLTTGDPETARAAVAFDDGVDAMNLSLTERCYDILRRETPVASDLRFVVSVLRILSEFERVGDLALRVVNELPERRLWAENPQTAPVLESMADEAIGAYREALRAWSAQDLALAEQVATRADRMETHYETLLRELFRLDGPDAVRTAVSALIAGRALERIADHAVIIGARLRYLLTGDPDHLAAEVR